MVYRLSEKAMAPHSSTLAWKIPWTEETGRLQSMGSLRVGHDYLKSKISIHLKLLFLNKCCYIKLLLQHEKQIILTRQNHGSVIDLLCMRDIRTASFFLFLQSDFSDWLKSVVQNLTSISLFFSSLKLQSTNSVIVSEQRHLLR